jgi:hypothetical protein
MDLMNRESGKLFRESIAKARPKNKQELARCGGKGMGAGREQSVKRYKGEGVHSTAEKMSKSSMVDLDYDERHRWLDRQAEVDHVGPSKWY